MVGSPAWPTLRAWWQRVCLERVLVDKDPMAGVIQAAHDYAGGLSLLLALENESTQGDTDGRIYKSSRTRATPARASSGNERSTGTEGG